jgi:hypothetical protein
MQVLRNRVALCALIVAIECSAAGEQALSGRVTPSSGLAPSDVVIQAFIEPNPLNRSVTFVVDSASFYTSSVVPLDGDRAPRAKQVRFRMLPAGSYEVTLTLIGADGERGYFTRTIELW